MLVLYATYTSPHSGLRSLMNRSTIMRLHGRTVAILRENQSISPVLATDLKILEHVERQVFSPPKISQSSCTAPQHSSIVKIPGIDQQRQWQKPWVSEGYPNATA